MGDRIRAVEDLREDVGADALHGVVGLGVLRRGHREGEQGGDVGALGRRRRLHEGDVLVGLHRLGHLIDERRVAGGVEGDQQRAGEAFAERRGGQIERLTFGALLGDVAVVGEAELEGEDGSRHREQQAGDTDGVLPGVARDVGTPGLPARRDGGVDLGALALAETVDPVAGDAEEGGQQRDGGEHHDQHDQRGGHTGGGHEGHAGDGETEDGDHDGAAGEDHGLTGGGGGATGGLDDRHALREVLAVAGDEEEGVVDAHTDADHGDHLRRPRRDVDEVVDEAEGAGAEGEAEQGGADRQAHGDDRTEGDEQDDDGGDDADHLAGAGAGLFEDEEQLTVGFDPQPVSLVELLAELLEILEGDGGDRVARRVLDTDERDGAVGRQLRFAHRDDVVEFGELGADLVDRGSVVGDRLAGGDRGDDELGARAGRVELGLFEQDQRIVAVLAGHREGVFEVASDGGVGDDHNGGEHEPGADHEPGSSSGEPAEPVQRGGHGVSLGEGRSLWTSAERNSTFATPP